MQLPGIKLYVAFAIIVFIEDIRRFMTAKHLVSYFVLNPAVNASGEQEPRQPALGIALARLTFATRSIKKTSRAFLEKAL